MTWLRFDEVGNTGKTKVWSVTNSKDGSYLGQVKWHGPWRQYIFTNYVENRSIGSIWNSECLIELSEFIKNEMNLRRN